MNDVRRETMVFMRLVVGESGSGARYCFNLSRYCRRSLATLGAITAWQ